MKTLSIYEQVQTVKRNEQQELISALRQYGEQVDGDYEYHYEGDCPIIAGYLCDEPCDIVILAVRVDKDGRMTLLGEDKQDRGEQFSIDPDEIFAGQLEYCIDEMII